MTRLSTYRRLILLSLVLLGLVGCAAGPERHDPLEPWNRRVMAFNDQVDALALKPLATVYRDAVPPLARTGVSNFFGNLSDAWSAVNSLLQLKIQHAADSVLRVSVNTVFGLGGLLDIASEAGIERHREDFGQTLGRWGVGAGPYLVLPILGPSTLRDTVALPVDMQGDPIGELKPASAATGLYVLRAVDFRANVLRAGDVLDAVALDRYRFVRDAYLQRRQSEVRDGAEDRTDGEDDSGKVEDPRATPAAPAAPGAPVSPSAR
jgi:phospholipid-binding lipoprotein MlaA